MTKIYRRSLCFLCALFLLTGLLACEGEKISDVPDTEQKGQLQEDDREQTTETDKPNETDKPSELPTDVQEPTEQTEQVVLKPQAPLKKSAFSYEKLSAPAELSDGYFYGYYQDENCVIYTQEDTSSRVDSLMYYSFADKKCVEYPIESVQRPHDAIPYADGILYVGYIYSFPGCVGQTHWAIKYTDGKNTKVIDSGPLPNGFTPSVFYVENMPYYIVATEYGYSIKRIEDGGKTVTVFNEIGCEIIRSNVRESNGEKFCFVIQYTGDKKEFVLCIADANGVITRYNTKGIISSATVTDRYAVCVVRGRTKDKYDIVAIDLSTKEITSFIYGKRNLYNIVGVGGTIIAKEENTGKLIAIDIQNKKCFKLDPPSNGRCAVELQEAGKDCVLIYSNVVGRSGHDLFKLYINR